MTIAPRNPESSKPSPPASSAGRNSSPYLLGGIILLAFLLRAALLPIAFGHIQRAYLPDSQTYITPAVRMLSGGGYPADSAWRTPIYPMFIGLIYRIGGQSPFLVIAVQVVIGSLSVLLTYLLGRRIFSTPAALLGALLLAVSVESITSGFYLMTETLFTFLFLAGMLAWVRGFGGRSKLWLAVAALLMGLAALCRPVAVYFPILLTCGLFFDRGMRWPGRLGRASLFLGAFFLVLVPWLVRNVLVIGTPALSTISSNNMLYYEAASLEAKLRNVSEAQVRSEYPGRVNRALAERGWADTEGNRARVEGRMARDIILDHPLRFVYIHLKSDLNGFLPDVTGPTEILGATIGGKGTLSVLNQYGLLAAIKNYFGDQTWLLWLLVPVIFLLGLVYILAANGTVDLLRRRRWLAVFVLAVPVAYFLLLPGAASLPRFRVPVMPYLCLLAGSGLCAAWSFFKGRKNNRNATHR